MWAWVLLAGCLGGARHEVALADLAPLGAEQLSALKDEEHAVALAVTLRAGAVADVTRAEAAVEQARLARDAARLDLDVARAGVEAARASRSPLRVGAALTLLEDARLAAEAADARLAWQEASRRAAEENVRLAEARVDLRRAELELARLDLLASAGRGVGYGHAGFTDAVRRARDRFEAAEAEHAEYADAAQEAWARWRERLAARGAMSDIDG